MHSSVRPHVLAMIVILIMAGCATTDSPSNTNALSGTSWALSILQGQSVPHLSPITIHFEQDRIQGSDGCNSYGASYTAMNSKFKAGKDIIATRMACPEPLRLQAEFFLSALSMANGYKQEPQQLTLLDANGNALATFAAQSSSLGGTSWHVTGYNNGKQAVVSVIIGSELTADFKADGRLGGSSGCNGYAAKYTSSGKSIKISQTATTRKMCAQPEGVMEQEAQYLKALSTAATYRLDGNRLELRTTAGALAVTLSSADNP